jgi:hypothetical protein
MLRVISICTLYLRTSGMDSGLAQLGQKQAMYI